MVQVRIKWNKNSYDVDVDVSSSVADFRSQIFSLTGVPPQRQKVMGVKGGLLKDDADLSTLGLKEGQQLLMMGSAEEVKIEKPAEKIVFMEDLPADEREGLQSGAIGGGLVNLGNSCYAAASLQCLRAIPELSSALKKVPGSFQNGNLSQSLAVAMRELMVELEGSKRPVTPLVFLTIMRQCFPQFAQTGEHGHFMQQDAEECLTQLIGALTPHLPSSSASSSSGSASSSSVSAARSLVDDLFGGEFTQTLTCDESPSETPVTLRESFRKLQCHLGFDVPSLDVGLRKSLEEQLDKRSSSLGREARYTKKMRISKLPPYLTVQFVRFQWKPVERVKAKILRSVSFPMILDVFDLCDETLKADLGSKRDAIRKFKDAAVQYEKDSKAAAAGSSSMALEKPVAPSLEGISTLGYYELFAVLTHRGRDAEGGHYTAWVKQAENSWFFFDDDKVTSCNDEDIRKLSGGGDWHMSYVLMYRAKTAEGHVVVL